MGLAALLMAATSPALAGAGSSGGGADRSGGYGDELTPSPLYIPSNGEIGNPNIDALTAVLRKNGAKIEVRENPGEVDFLMDGTKSGTSEFCRFEVRVFPFAYNTRNGRWIKNPSLILFFSEMTRLDGLEKGLDRFYDDSFMSIGGSPAWQVQYVASREEDVLKADFSEGVIQSEVKFLHDNVGRIKEITLVPYVGVHKSESCQF